VLTFLFFIIGFAVLIKGADFLVDGASSLARKLKVTPLAIGLTVVAFGTSLPELSVNVTASIYGNSDLATGNILGSNIANILLILGIASVIYPLSVSRGTVWREIPFCLLSVLVLFFASNDLLLDNAANSFLSRTDGLLFLLFFIIFIYYTATTAKASGDLDVEIKELTAFRAGLYIFLGLLGTIFGGQWIVNGAIEITKTFHVSETKVGLTIVALGTSLPELATSAVAAYKKNADIAVGNVVGSNIFNILMILGVSASIRPIPFDQKGNIHIGITILATVLLFTAMFTGKKGKIDRWEGIVFLVVYSGYIIFLVLY
jgi:cation:H+ antiporter